MYLNSDIATRVCSGDGVTGDGGDGNVTSDKIFTGEVTGEGMVTGEAFLTGDIYLDTLQMPPIQPYIFQFVPDLGPRASLYGPKAAWKCSRGRKWTGSLGLRSKNILFAVCGRVGNRQRLNEIAAAAADTQAWKQTEYLISFFPILITGLSNRNQALMKAC